MTTNNKLFSITSSFLTNSAAGPVSNILSNSVYNPVSNSVYNPVYNPSSSPVHNPSSSPVHNLSSSPVHNLVYNPSSNPVHNLVHNPSSPVHNLVHNPSSSPVYKSPNFSDGILGFPIYKIPNTLLLYSIFHGSFSDLTHPSNKYLCAFLSSHLPRCFDEPELLINTLTAGNDKSLTSGLYVE